MSLIAPDTTSYNWVLYGFLLSPASLAQRASLVRGVFERMEADGVPPNTVTFSRAALALHVEPLVVPSFLDTTMEPEEEKGANDVEVVYNADGAAAAAAAAADALSLFRHGSGYGSGVGGGSGSGGGSDGQDAWRCVSAVYRRALAAGVLQLPGAD